MVAKEIARVYATTQQVSGGNELVAWPLLLGGSEEQRRRWLTPIAAGEALGAFPLSEPEAGSRGISAFVLEKTDAGLSFGAPEKKMGLKGSPRPRCTSTTCRCRPTD